MTLFRFARVLAISSMTLVLAGCLGHTPTDKIDAAPITPAPVALPAEGLQPYQLQIGDVLDIKLMLNPELNDQVTVRPDGMISTTVVADVPAYGRTVAELKKDLEERYNHQLVNPQLAIILRSFAPTRVYVAGEVNQPGEFINVGPSLTLLQAISRAGGVKNSAGTDKVLILRRGAGDKPVAYLANYTSATTGVDVSKDVRLAPFDVVYVPRSDIGNVYLHFQQYIQQFVPVAFGVNYQINPADVD